MNLRPSGYEPDELPGCSTPRQGSFRERDLRSTGLAVTYSPASLDAVPSALRRLTAEFGMGSGVSLALEPPNLWSTAHEGLAKSLTGRGRTKGRRGAGPPPDRIKPVGRLVPVD